MECDNCPHDYYRVAYEIRHSFRDPTRFMIEMSRQGHSFVTVKDGQKSPFTIFAESINPPLNQLDNK